MSAGLCFWFVAVAPVPVLGLTGGEVVRVEPGGEQPVRQVWPTERNLPTTYQPFAEDDALEILSERRLALYLGADCAE